MTAVHRLLQIIPHQVQNRNQLMRKISQKIKIREKIKTMEKKKIKERRKIEGRTTINKFQSQGRNRNQQIYRIFLRN